MNDLMTGILGDWEPTSARPSTCTSTMVRRRRPPPCCSTASNNPLATVIGRTELILSDLEGQQSPLREDLETVLRSPQRCNTALGNLLAYSIISDPDEGKTSQMTNEGRISE